MPGCGASIRIEVGSRQVGRRRGGYQTGREDDGMRGWGYTAGWICRLQRGMRMRDVLGPVADAALDPDAEAAPDNVCIISSGSLSSRFWTV